MLVVVASLAGIGAARVPGGPHQSALCIPILMSCPTPTAPPSSPSPSESATSDPAPSDTASPQPSDASTPAPTTSPGTSTDGTSTDPGVTLPGGTPSTTPTSPSTATAPTSATDDGTPAKNEKPADAIDDPGNTVFTLPSAQLGGSSINITGLHSVTLVNVTLVNGKKTPALRISSDSVAVDDFVLDVRAETGPKLVTTSARMELTGHAVVYVNSITGTVGGKTVTIGVDTPSPGDELPAQLLGVHLGLVGATGDQISFIPSHQSLSE